MSIITTLQPFLHAPVSQAIAWALLHFVWQGALVGVTTWATLGFLGRSAANVRYVVGTIALAVMITLPGVTAVQLWRTGTSPSRLDAAACSQGGFECSPGGGALERTGPAVVQAASVAPALAPPPGDAARRRSAVFESALSVLVLIWLCGVGVLTARLLTGWLSVQRLKSRGTSAVAAHWQTVAMRIRQRLHIARPVRLLQSTGVDVPTVIGWLKPVVLLPASTLAGLAPEQLEAILAHELAHVSRHDYLVNLLQTVVETLLFYHPAVWWLSARVRAERENCCDDVAVRLCGDPVTYARALASLEELRANGSVLAMAANGGSLVARVRRLLGTPAQSGGAPGWLGAAVVLLLVSSVAAGSAGVNAFGWPRAHAVMHDAVATNPSAISAALRPAAKEMAPVDPAVVRPLATPSTTRLAAAGVPELPAVAVLPPAKSQLHESGEVHQSGPVHRSFSWSNDGEKLQVTYDGEAEFSDDDADVQSLSAGGMLKLKDGWMFPSHTVEFTADGAGKITRRFWLGMSERPFDPEGRRWVAGVMPRFIRQTGIGAPARVRRIFARGGAASVFTEISRIEGSYGKRVYFVELLKTATLDSEAIRRLLAQASREIDSDFELASLLIDGTEKLMVDGPTRQAYFEAARTIDSDFEMHRVYSAAIKRGSLDPAAVASLLTTSRNIESDFEEASLLIEVAKAVTLDATTRAPFFTALATVDSDFEHHRVLTAVAGRQDHSEATTSAMLRSAAFIKSDFETASLLVDVATHQPVEGEIREPFFQAVDTVGSSFERGRVLQALAARHDVSMDTIGAILRAAAKIDGGFERSNVLLAVAQSRTLTGPVREAYIAAADNLGEFDQGKVLTALVKGERRPPAAAGDPRAPK